ncbi:outer membrane receptor FepA [Salmonella enterica subsp. enterica]|uniref:Outer membrane receptor FepA n=1 Tax=Salmonella enterica I TaxID=59201 RepID=A0A447PQC2_SALET|nr:outer membrane receptor FepA [Salmonella enterica subsp. enterica]
MNKKIHSLTLLVNLGIYGAALPVMAEDKTDSAALTNEDTIVVTAAQQKPTGAWRIHHHRR